MTLKELLEMTPKERAATYRQWAADEAEPEMKMEYLRVAEMLDPSGSLIDA